MSAWLSLEDAVEQASSHIQPIIEIETISLAQANGRIIAKSIVSPVDVPPWNNSAMDGYAIKLSGNEGSNTRQVSQTIYAGSKEHQTVTDEQCARIMTGAPMPSGADTVVMQENVIRTEDSIEFTQPPVLGDNIRPKSGDIALGDELFAVGHKILPQDIMLMSSIGLANVEVYKKPKVAVIATGDELAEPGTERGDHQIFESHRGGLAAKLEALGCDVTDAGLVKDDKDTIVNVFTSLSQTHDMVISSGGVSVGDADWVKPALSSLGSLHLWKVAIKPGKPFAFGQFGHCYFCGLPGNPVSAFVTFDQIVTPLLGVLKNQAVNSKPLTLKATLTSPFKRRAGRKEFARGVYRQNENGQLEVSLLKKQGSSVMTSLTNANCYVIIPSESESLGSGASVDIQPFSLT